MDNYTVVFIDDEQDIIDDFLATAEQQSLNVKVLNLVPNEEAMVQEIIQSNVDAIIIDYSLRDTRSDIKYNGVQILRLLEHDTYDFPKFILTGFSSLAEDASNDVNIVYAKEDDFTPFIQRVIKQITKHKEKMSTYEEELQALIKKSKNQNLSIPEEERIIELDSIIEKTLHKKTAIPISLKSPSTLQKLDELLSKTKKISEELTGKLDE